MTKYSINTPENNHFAAGIVDGYFIRIEEGPFKGVEYTYKNLQMKGEMEDGNFLIEYDYDVWNKPVVDDSLTVAQFEEVITPILYQLMESVRDSIQEVNSPEDILEVPEEGTEFSEHELFKEEV